MSDVLRELCNAVEPVPGPLPARCSRSPHQGEDHEWMPSMAVLQRVDLQRQAITAESAEAISRTRHEAAPVIAVAADAGDRLPARGVVRRVKARWSV